MSTDGTRSAATPPLLRIGLAGLGRAGAAMLPSMLAHPLVKVVAAADPRAEPRDKFEVDLQGETYETVQELCTSPNVDVVYVATPHQFHVENVVAAANAGKHVICEKPMALSLAECDAMIEAVERAGVCLVVGHTHSHDPAIRAMRRIIRGGQLGRLGMINNWVYTDFLYRPRRPEELDTSLGGGILFNQVPHQVDMVRHLGGGLVRSVRASTGVWDRQRLTEGASAVFLEFQDGAAATLVYNGYDHFDTDEFHFWVGEGGQEKGPDRHGLARKGLADVASPREEAARKYATGYGGSSPAAESRGRNVVHQPHFGALLVSCERGDMRPSADGVLIYDADGKREITLPPSRSLPGRGDVLDELHAAVFEGRPVFHGGRWGKATLAVCLAIQESARERREVMVEHQVPTADAAWDA